jgi:hypothetical protein
MQPLFGNIRVYYAHLNEQWVEPGDFVLTRILAVTRNAFVATSAGVR